MTASKCIQLVLYGLIAGYELPRMKAKFSASGKPTVILTKRSIPEFQCNPGQEIDNLDLVKQRAKY